MVSFHLLIFWVAFGNGLQFAMEHRHIGKDIGKTWYNISVNEPFFCHSNVEVTEGNLVRFNSYFGGELGVLIYD